VDDIVSSDLEGNMMKRILWSLWLCWSLAGAMPPTQYEKEPNDTPSQATRFSGETVLTGKLHKGDQDAYLWHVGSEESLYSWRIGVDGLSGAATRVDLLKIFFEKDGKRVRDYRKFFSFGTRTGVKPVHLKHLFLKEGDYMLAVTSNSPEEGAYTIRIEKEKACDKIKEAPQSDPASFATESQYYRYLVEKSPLWFSFEVKKEQKEYMWQFDAATTVGTDASLSLYDASHTLLAEAQSNRFGKMRIKGLELDEGKYLAVFKSNTSSVHFFPFLHIMGMQKRDTDEKEPNNDKEHANIISYRKSLHGEIDGNDRDYLLFTLPSKLEGKIFDIRLDTNVTDLQFALYDDHNNELQDLRADSNYTMSDLQLETDRNYYLYIGGYHDRGYYTVLFENIREFDPSKETEPNNEIVSAVKVDVNRTVNAYFRGTEYDCFRFDIVRPNRFWRVVSEGDTISYMNLYDARQKKLASIDYRKDGKLMIDTLFLRMGSYYSCLSGKNGSYSFRVEEVSAGELGIDSFDMLEHEPNNDERHKNILRAGMSIKGTFASGDDEDYFRFILKNDTHIRLHATPPKDGDVRIKLYSDTMTQRAYPKKEGEESILEGIYPAGIYTIDLWSKKPGHGLYTLKLEYLDPFEWNDSEPNDERLLAGELPSDFTLKGYTSNDDEDWYRLPSWMTKESNLTLYGENLKGNISVYEEGVRHSLEMQWSDENKSYTLALAHPSRTYIMVDDDTGFYHYKLLFSAYEPKVSEPLNVEMNLTAPTMYIKADAQKGQSVKASLHLAYRGEGNVSYTIRSHCSDAAWHIKTEDNVTLSSDGSVTIPVKIRIPKGVLKGRYFITVELSDASGAFRTASLQIESTSEAPLAGPFEDWGLPDVMTGGLNVADSRLGAERVIEHQEEREGYVPKIGNNYPMLFDGITDKGEGFYLYSGRKQADENVTVKLAGEGEKEIVGVILDPLGRGDMDSMLKSFTVWLSSDGKVYRKVYTGALKRQMRAQIFTFDKPSTARYARLTLHTNQRNDPKGEITLGEWKVIAKPGSVRMAKPFNLGDPKLGGHVVWASQVISTNWDRYLLTPEEDLSKSLYQYADRSPLSFVVGFRNERQAMISEIVWREPKESKKKTRIKEVKVYISTQTPFGPWTALPVWHKSDAIENRYRFSTPVGMRYIKFVLPKLTKNGYWTLPQSLQFFEAPESDHYRSVLAEWGGTTDRAYDIYFQNRQNQKREVISGNGSREKAYLLDLNTTVHGEVSVARHQSDWYKIILPEKTNALDLDLSNPEGVEVTALLYDSNGTICEPQKRTKMPEQLHLHYEIAPGNYYLKVEEPVISVVFAWDNSGSVSPYHDRIFNAVNNYIDTIQSGIEAVNLLCFNRSERFVLADFSEDKESIQMIYNNYDWDCSDSDAERPLKAASEKMAHREGIRGVIIIGDAVGSREKGLWDTLKEVKPKVFSIRVMSQYNDNELYEGIMQSWSRINNGEYRVAHNGEEIYQAINQAVAKLRAPVTYTLKADVSYVKPVGPGSLKIVSDSRMNTQMNRNFAIELILDASGSMLQRIKGKRKIAIARDVLKRAVREIIPPRTPVALRVFGHKEADSCRTDLEMRLHPLNRGRMLQVIGHINAKNLAKTPIAASLAKVAEDLEHKKGKKVIILVTDGEETCEGNPREEIEKLKAKGYDVRINIVGFAIDDEGLKSQFKEWAKLGNGAYFEAKDQRSLSAAIEKALQIPYSVYNRKHERVARGMIGAEPVTLPQGTYQVVIESAPPYMLKEVKVVGEKLNIVKIGGMQ
jgi:Mg-chelatase subunit ChlD